MRLTTRSFSGSYFETFADSAPVHSPVIFIGTTIWSERKEQVWRAFREVNRLLYSYILPVYKPVPLHMSVRSRYLNERTMLAWNNRLLMIG